MAHDLGVRTASGPQCHRPWWGDPERVSVPRPPVSGGAPRLPAVSGPSGAALGLPAGAAGALLTWTLGGDPTIGLVLAAATAVWLAALTTPLGALVAAAQCWACFDGFVVHRLGTLEGGPVDIVAFGIVACAAVAAQAVRAMATRGRTSTRLRSYPHLRFPGPLSSAGTVAQ